MSVENLNHMTELSQDISAQPMNNEQFTVLGAGVIGLLTAKELAEQGYNVKIVTKDDPAQGGEATSSIAIGQFLPWVPEEHAEVLLKGVPLGEVTDFSRKFYQELAQAPHETGVMEVRNVEYVRSDSPWPAGLPAAMNSVPQDLEEPVMFTEPSGEEVAFDQVHVFDTFSINARKTVQYLADRVKSLGVQFEQKVVKLNDLNDLDGIIINATGMGADKLDPTQVVNKYKGHTFVVKPQEGTQLPKEAFSIEDLIIVPREDGTAVCGALYIENPERPLPEEEEAKELFDRLGKFTHEVARQVDGLEPDFLEHVDVLLHSAGYRVEVEGAGIRVAPDEEHKRLLHAYGFGGLGWSVGSHFAKEIAKQAVDMNKGVKNEQ